MLLDRSGIAMAQLGRDHRERDAAHGEPAGVGMSQPVEIDRRLDPGCGTGCGERTLLLGLRPRLSVPTQEQAGARPPSRKRGYEVATFLRQHNMARLSALACADAER